MRLFDQTEMAYVSKHDQLGSTILRGQKYNTNVVHLVDEIVRVNQEHGVV